VTDRLLFLGGHRAAVIELLQGGCTEAELLGGLTSTRCLAVQRGGVAPELGPTCGQSVTFSVPRKLSYAEAEDIRRRWRLGETSRALATAYGVSEFVVSQIINHRTYTEPLLTERYEGVF